MRENAAEALGKIGNSIAIEPLISVLNDNSSFVKETALKALAKIVNPETLAKLIQYPEINIYDRDIFPFARTLALRFSKKPPRNKKGQPLIPVYPELVKYNPVRSLVKRLSYFLKDSDTFK